MIRSSTRVQWVWGSGQATGTVQTVFHETVTRRIDGSDITRKGSRDTPAYLIEQDNGQRVLKLATEVERADA
jgi:hypothetical protein